MGASGSNPNPPKEQPSSSPSPSEAPSARNRYAIVLIEDNPAARHNTGANLIVIRDGETAIRLIDRADSDESAPCPSLFLLDLNLPAKTGEEVLAHIRRSKRCAHAPVVIVTSSDSPQDRARAERLGANRYFRKPADYDDFMRIGEIVKELLVDSEPRA